jgi:hypothetical protein
MAGSGSGPSTAFQFTPCLLRNYRALIANGAGSTVHEGERARAGIQAVFLPVRSVNKGGVISWNEVHKGKRTCVDVRRDTIQRDDESCKAMAK